MIKIIKTWALVYFSFLILGIVCGFMTLNSSRPIDELTVAIITPITVYFVINWILLYLINLNAIKIDKTDLKIPKDFPDIVTFVVIMFASSIIMILIPLGISLPLYQLLGINWAVNSAWHIMLPMLWILSGFVGALFAEIIILIINRWTDSLELIANRAKLWVQEDIFRFNIFTWVQR